MKLQYTNSVYNNTLSLVRHPWQSERKSQLKGPAFETICSFERPVMAHVRNMHSLNVKNTTKVRPVPWSISPLETDLSGFVLVTADLDGLLDPGIQLDNQRNAGVLCALQHDYDTQTIVHSD